MNSFIGGGLLMTIGGVIALISYLSRDGVTVDRTLTERASSESEV